MIINPYGGNSLTAGQLADCQSGSVVTDLEENPSGARKSSTHVYDAYCDLLVEANPATFVALDYWYGKDSNGVWLLDSPLDEPLITQTIIGADPTSFILIPDESGYANSMYPNENFSAVYTKDKNHVYYIGDVVNGVDPVSFTLPADTSE